MKKFAVLLVIFACAGSANAEWFQFNNPFNSQTAPEMYNNIYETEPAVIQKEAQQKKKAWWKIKGDAAVEQNETNKVNEGIQNGNFYILK